LRIQIGIRDVARGGKKRHFLAFSNVFVLILAILLQSLRSMGTTQQLPVSPSEQPPIAAATEGGEQQANEQSLVATASTSEPNYEEEVEDGPLQGPLAMLPVELDVAVAVRDFRVRNLLSLEPGQVIESQWNNGDDLPIASGEVQLAWSEFEVLENDLAVRITRLA